MLQTEWFVAVVRLREENDGSYISLVEAVNMSQSDGLPGTSSVRGSLNIPKLHFLVGLELFSFCGEGVVASPLPCAGADCGCFRKPPKMPIMLRRKLNSNQSRYKSESGGGRVVV